jgi:hypothetical protein
VKSGNELRHVGSPVRFSAQISATPTGRFSVIFDTADFYEKLSINSKFCKNPAKISGSLQEATL